MVLKNDRVLQILEFIEKFKVCDITHISRLFFSTNKYAEINARKKMRDLVQDKYLKKCRDESSMKNIYFYSKPAQLQHKLLLTEFYIRMCEIYGRENIEIEIEWSGLPGIRPDAFMKVKVNKRLYLFFVEVQVSNNPCDIAKYEIVYEYNKVEKVFQDNVFPVVIFITDQKIESCCRQFYVKAIDTDLKNVGEII